MKSTRNKILFGLLSALGILLLSGCTVNIITDIQADGSGMVTMEYGFTQDELVTYGMAVDETLCTSLMDGSEQQPNTTTRQEQRGDEIWCIYETPFATLDELRTIYSDMDGTINDLRIEDGVAYYDITLLGEGSDPTIPIAASWIVKMPGSVTDHNATEVDGNTLTWEMSTGGTLNAYATSKVGGLSSTVWWIVGIASFCLCLVVLATVVVLVIVLVRRNKKKAETPAPG